MRLNEEQIESPALNRYQQWWGVFSLPLQTWHAFAKSVGKLFMAILFCPDFRLRIANFLYNQMQDVDLKDENRNTWIFWLKCVMKPMICCVVWLLLHANASYTYSAAVVNDANEDWEYTADDVIAVSPLESHYTTFPFINRTLCLAFFLYLQLSLSLFPPHSALSVSYSHSLSLSVFFCHCLCLSFTCFPVSLCAVFNVPAVFTPRQRVQHFNLGSVYMTSALSLKHKP